MIRGLYTSAMGMMVEQTRQDVTANNLANTNTTGYKKDTAVFKTFPEMLLRRVHDHSPLDPSEIPIPGPDKRPILGTMGTGSTVDQVVTSHLMQGVRRTDNPLDLAFNGEGFFVVQTPQGERYTRNGAFKTMPVEGQTDVLRLVTNDGYGVLDEQGNEILIPAAAQIDVDQEGRIWDQDTLVATLRLVIFPEIARDPGLREAIGAEGLPDDSLSPIKKMGDSLFGPNDLGPNPATGEGAVNPVDVPREYRNIQQGFLELPNVNPISEMVTMIQVARAYEANQKMIQSQDETLEKAISVGNR